MELELTPGQPKKFFFWTRDPDTQTPTAPTAIDVTYYDAATETPQALTAELDDPQADGFYFVQLSAISANIGESGYLKIKITLVDHSDILIVYVKFSEGYSENTLIEGVARKVEENDHYVPLRRILYRANKNETYSRGGTELKFTPEESDLGLSAYTWDLLLDGSKYSLEAFEDVLYMDDDMPDISGIYSFQIMGTHTGTGKIKVFSGNIELR